MILCLDHYNKRKEPCFCETRLVYIFINNCKVAQCINTSQVLLKIIFYSHTQVINRAIQLLQKRNPILETMFKNIMLLRTIYWKKAGPPNFTLIKSHMIL